MTYVPIWLRKLVEERANERCEYCLAQKRIVISLEIDHVIPASIGGESIIDNLCLTCKGCNGFKLAHTTGVDPESGEETTLFHPRVDRWKDYFVWSDDGIRVVGLTATGRATISRLRMNRADALRGRRVWVEAGWHPPEHESE